MKKTPYSRENLLRALNEWPAMRQYAQGIMDHVEERPNERDKVVYLRVITRFIAWVEGLERKEGGGLMSMPFSEDVVVRYARDLDEKGFAYYTVMSYLGMVSMMHEVSGVCNPVRQESVVAVRRELLERKKEGSRLHWSETDLKHIFHCINFPLPRPGNQLETIAEIRERVALDKALLLTMMQTGIRRTEAVDLTWGNVRENPDGTGILVQRSNWSHIEEAELVITKVCMQALLAIKPAGVGPHDSVFGLIGEKIVGRFVAMCKDAGLLTEGVGGDTPRASLVALIKTKGGPRGLRYQIRVGHNHAIMKHTKGPGDVREWLEAQPS